MKNFRAAIFSRSSLTLTTQGALSARYENRLGDTIECTYDGEDSINSTATDYKAWPLSESPWTSRKTEMDPLVVTDGKSERIYDFVNWTITQRAK